MAVMIAAGTGISPTRAFIQEQAAISDGGGPEALGPGFLYHGCRDHQEDYIYCEELAD